MWHSLLFTQISHIITKGESPLAFIPIRISFIDSLVLLSPPNPSLSIRHAARTAVFHLSIGPTRRGPGDAFRI